MTRTMRVLNFFASNSGSPSCTHSEIIFSELNFHQEWLVELFVQDVLGDLVPVRKEFSVTLKRVTPNTVPSTFLCHQFCNTDHKTFSLFSLCLAIGFPMHAFFAFCVKSKIITRNARNRGFKHCENTEQSSVLVCFFEKSEDFIEVWNVNAHRVTVHRGDLVELLGFINCVEGGLGQRAKLLAARAEMHMPYAFRTGKYGKNVWTSKSGLVSK